MRPTDSLPPYLPPTNRNFRRGEKFQNVPQKMPVQPSPFLLQLSSATFFLVPTPTDPTSKRLFFDLFQVSIMCFFSAEFDKLCGKGTPVAGSGGLVGSRATLFKAPPAESAEEGAESASRFLLPLNVGGLRLLPPQFPSSDCHFARFAAYSRGGTANRLCQGPGPEGKSRWRRLAGRAPALQRGQKMLWTR